jgi:hypothetical protein
MVEAQTEETQVKDQACSSPVLTIVIQSWMIPIVGTLMLVIGLFGGYFTQPLIKPQSSPIIASPSTETASSSGASASPKIQTSNPEELAAFLVSSTRHFKGDSDAPVTMIEFSDFQ